MKKKNVKFTLIEEGELYKKIYNKGYCDGMIKILNDNIEKEKQEIRAAKVFDLYSTFWRNYYDYV